MSFDSVDVAILSKVNQLAERYGIKPYDITATISLKEGLDQHVLHFESLPGDPEKLRQAEQMLLAIGTDSEHMMIGTDAEIYEALDGALQRAPRRMHR